MKYKEFKETFLNPTQKDSIENFNGWEHFLPMIGRYIVRATSVCRKSKEYAKGWIALLMKNPELASECGKWKEFNTEDWGWLLSKQPQFADKCDKWEKFSVLNWENLLLAQP